MVSIRWGAEILDVFRRGPWRLQALHRTVVPECTLTPFLLWGLLTRTEYCEEAILSLMGHGGASKVPTATREVATVQRAYRTLMRHPPFMASFALRKASSWRRRPNLRLELPKALWYV